MQRTCTTYNALDLRIYNLVCIPVWPAFFTLAFVPNSKINTRFHDVMQRRAVDNFVCSSIEIMPVIVGFFGPTIHLDVLRRLSVTIDPIDSIEGMEI